MFPEGGQTRKHCFLAMFPEGGQTRKHCFLAMFPEGGQTRKHCFLAMFLEGGQTRKHCFLAMFPEGGQTRKHCFRAMFPKGGQTRKHCFLAMFPEGGQTRKHSYRKWATSFNQSSLLRHSTNLAVCSFPQHFEKVEIFKWKMWDSIHLMLPWFSLAASLSNITAYRWTRRKLIETARFGRAFW
jgi:allantoicase